MRYSVLCFGCPQYSLSKYCAKDAWGGKSEADTCNDISKNLRLSSRSEEATCSWRLRKKEILLMFPITVEGKY